MAISIGIIEATLRLRDEMSRDVAKAQQTLTGLGTAARTAGLTMTAGLTVPIAAIGTSAVRAAIDFEDSFTGVLKTVDDATDALGMLNEEGIELARNMREMSRELPFTTRELNGIGEAAGQLGIRTENIAEFTRVMASLGATTNLAADEAARSLARLANITGLQQTEFSNLGSAVVDLGNNFATTEGELVTFALRIAASGRLAGLSQGEILGLGTAMSAVGVQAEAGGTAVQKVLTAMIKAVAQGGAELNVFAQTAGTSTQEFAEKFRVDAAGAFQDFVNGLKTAGDDAFNILDDLSLGNERVVRAFLSLANAGDLVTEAMDLGARAFEENTALAIEAEKRFRTFQSQLTVLSNIVKDIAVSFGNALLPMLQRVIIAIRDNVLPAIESMVRAFQELSPGVQAGIVAFTGILAIAGPVVAILGLIVAGIGAALPVLTAMGVTLGGAATAVTLLTGSIAGAGGLVASFLAAGDGAGNVASGINRIEGPLRNVAVAASDARREINGATEAVEGLETEIENLPEQSARSATELEKLGENASELGGAFWDAGVAIVDVAKGPIATGVMIIVNEIASMTDFALSLLNTIADGFLAAMEIVEIATALTEDAIRGNSDQLETFLRATDETANVLGEIGVAIEVSKGPWEAYRESLRGAKLDMSNMVPGIRNLQGQLEGVGVAIVELTEDQQDLMNAISGSDLQSEVEDLVAVFGALASQGTLTAETAMRVAEAAASLQDEGAELNTELQFLVRHFQELEIVLNRLPRQLSLADALDHLNRGLVETGGEAALLVDGILPQVPIDKTALSVKSLGTKLDKASDSLERVRREALLAMSGLDKLGLAISEIDFVGIIVGAVQGGGDIRGALGAGIGGSIGSVLGNQMAEQFTSAWGKALANAQSGIGAVAGQVLLEGGQHSTAALIASGTALGAQIGTAIMPGIGTAVGAGIGALAGLFRGLGRSTAEDVEIAGREIGFMLSEEMIETFAEQVDSGEFRSEWAAVMGNLADVIQDSGGVAEVGVGRSIELTRDLFSFLEMGQLTVEQTGKAFQEVFAILLPEVLADGSDSVNEAFAELMGVARDFADRMGVDITEALAMLSSEFDKVFNDLLTRAVQDGFESVEEEFNRAIALAQQFGVDMSGSIEGFQARLDELNLEKLEILKTIANEGATALETFAESGIGGAVGLQAASGAALALFDQLIASGASFSEAFAAISPTLEALGEKFEEFGVDVPKALQPLIEAASLLGDEFAGPVVKGAIAAGDVLKSLNSLGVLNNKTFALFGASIKGAFQNLLDSGVSSEAALLALREPLATLIFLQDTYGFKVDEGTQALIDQAREAGITGEDSKTAAEKQLDAINLLIDAIKELIRLFRDEVGDAAEEAGAAVEDGFPDTVEIDVVFNTDGATVSIDENGETTALAEGGVITRPIIGLVGEAGPEAVIPLDRLSEMGGNDGAAIEALRDEMAAENQRLLDELPEAIATQLAFVLVNQ